VTGEYKVSVKGELMTQNPKAQNPRLKSYTLHPTLSTLNTQLSTLNHKSYIPAARSPLSLT